MIDAKTQKKLLFAVLFAVVGFILLQIKFTKLAGSNVSFTLFDFFAPIAGAFLGGPLGIVSVLLVNVTNLFLSKSPIETASIIRLFPTLFAVYYFSLPREKKTSPAILAVPILAIIAFVAHPIGRTVWYFSLFWLIPIAAFFKRDNILIRSLGSTFTAHAVGGAAWIWALKLPATVWKNLIPIVIEERLAFTLGIAASFLLVNNLLNKLIAKKVIPSVLKIEKPYIFSS